MKWPKCFQWSGLAGIATNADLEGFHGTNNSRYSFSDAPITQHREPRLEINFIFKLMVHKVHVEYIKISSDVIFDAR